KGTGSHGNILLTSCVRSKGDGQLFPTPARPSTGGPRKTRGRPGRPTAPRAQPLSQGLGKRSPRPAPLARPVQAHPPSTLECFSSRNSFIGAARAAREGAEIGGSGAS